MGVWNDWRVNKGAFYLPDYDLISVNPLIHQFQAEYKLTSPLKRLKES